MIETEIAIVGSGIVGLAHAWAAAKRGKSVTVFERTAQAEAASVRNFGTIWPIGVAEGPLRQAALRSREMWIELADRAGFWLNPCGSLHLIRATDEHAVAVEYCDSIAGREGGCRILTPAETHQQCPATVSQDLRGALHSPLECAIDPRQAIAAIARFLAEKHHVRFEFNTTVIDVESPVLRAADGRRWRFQQALICGGADFLTLFPAVFASSGIRRCKLQMMRTVAQPNGWRLGPHIAGGATMRHYPSFANCPSVDLVRQRIAQQSPELDRFGIHVLVAQNQAGEITIGDSHEYDQAITPFDKTEIDQIILNHMSRMLELPDPRIAQHWHGIYARHPSLAEFIANPQDKVKIVVNSNGIGLTVSFALAEDRLV